MILKKEDAIKFIQELKTDMAEAKPSVGLGMFDAVIEKLSQLSGTDEINMRYIVGPLMLGYAGSAVVHVKLALAEQMAKVIM